MALPIKTQVLQALVTALLTASDLVSVERFPPTTTHLELARTPIAYIAEAAPETRETNNRFYQGTLELDITVFIELQSGESDEGNLTFLDKADEIQAQIHDILLGPNAPGLIPFGVKILERSSEKLISNDQWGALLYTVEVTYQHLMGDAFAKS